MKKTLILSLLLMSCLTILIFPDELVRVPYPMTMRQRGMGDAFTAVADDYYLLFTNPAGLTQFKTQTEPDNYIIQIPFGSLGTGVQNKVVSNSLALMEALENFDSTDPEQLTGILDTLGNFNRENFGFMIEDPLLSFGMLNENIGFNIASFLLDANIKPVIGLSPEIYLDISASLQAIVGISPFSFELFEDSRLDIGFGVKGFVLSDFTGSIELIDIAQWGSSENAAADWFLDNMDTGFGIGLNAGAILSLPWGLNIGLSVLDAPSLIFYPDFRGVEELQTRFAFPNIRTGVSYSLNRQAVIADWPTWLLNKPVFAFDLTNLFDPSYPGAARVHLGMNVDFINTEIFNLNTSVGLNKGYGTFSASARIFILYLHYALWQDEYGIEVGDYPVWQHLFSINVQL